MSEQQAAFTGWARVEVMGHQTHIGYVKTEAYGGAVLFRVDVPDFPERQYVLEDPAYIDGRWTPKGATVQRAAMPGGSVLIGAASIYRMIPCTEEAAMKAIEREQRAELKLVSLPANAALPAPEAEDDSDLCLDCGKAEEYCRCPI